MQQPFPKLQKRIFWDVDFENINYDESYRFVIERVFERGDVQDIREVRRFYGDEMISRVLITAKSLSERRLHLAAAVINKPVTDFRCYELRLLNRELYPY